MKLLVYEVDTKLLEAVAVEYFEAVDVEDADGEAALVARGHGQCLVHSGD